MDLPDHPAAKVAMATPLAQSATFCREHLRDIETQLDATDPIRVVACVVKGYTDPPERVAAAERERAAGVFHAGPMTVEAVKAFEAGQLKAPSMSGLSNPQIHEAKAQAVQYRKALEIAESMTNG